MQNAIDDARTSMASALARGESGREVCQALSKVYDNLVGEIWSAAMQEIAPQNNARLALVALGGWGREEMCPYSDIDFILLHEEDADVELTAQIAEKTLYPLWDAKVNVGHALRSVNQATALAKEDLPTATALLDARLVAGDKVEFSRLLHATQSAIAPGGNANHFIARLQKEQRSRHDRFGASLYLLEPNIKHGIGGLRDYNTAHWAARARFGVGIPGLSSKGVLSNRQSHVMKRGINFMLKIRCLIQLGTGRLNDQLSFELQEEIGPDMYPNARAAEGVIVPSVTPGVEALMRDYYLQGRGIARVSDRVLEVANTPKQTKPRIRKIDRSFLVWNSKLAVRERSVFRDTPEEMLRYFRVALEVQAPLYGHTLELIESQIGEFAVGESRKLWLFPKAAQYFLEALCDLADSATESMLHSMHAVGLLAAMIPEFGPCTGRVQHDLYHVYTVDRHQLFAVEMLKRTGRGELGTQGAVAMEAYQSLEEFESLYLATLLHDVAKPLGAGHAVNGGRIVRRVAKSFGMSEHAGEMAEFLVRQHLTMSHISQRRDLSDPEVIEKFATLVGSVDALTKLYLLTRCDTAMTGPSNLSSWKDQLLSELYTSTRDHLRGGKDLESEAAVGRRQTRVRAVEIVMQEGGELRAGAIAHTIVHSLDDGFVSATNANQLARLVRCAIRRDDEGLRFAVHAHSVMQRGQTELVCICDDIPAILSKVTGVLWAHRVHIDNALIASFESKQGAVAAQIFQVRDNFDQVIPNEDRRWARIEEDLLKVTRSTEASMASLLATREESVYSLKPQISTRDDIQVKVFDGESSEFSVVEIHTPDAVGLLYSITKELFNFGLDIHRAFIGTEGDRVADVFYVKKISDGEKLSPVDRDALVSVITSMIEDLV